MIVQVYYSQNSTFTIGTALIDLAQDSDVVHNTGDETVGGNKTFTNDVTVNNSNATVQTDVPNLVFKNPLVERASTTLEGEQTILFTDKNDNNIASIQAKTSASGGVSDLILISYSETGDQSIKTTGVIVRRTPTTSKFQPYSDNITTLGETNKRWSRIYGAEYYYGSNNVEFSTKFVTTDTAQTISGNKTFSSINGVEPSSLSLPNFSGRIDISSYVTNLNGTYNAYTPSVNGWIAIQSSDATFIRIADTGSGGLGNTSTSQTAGTLTCMMPVSANRQSNIYIVCTTLVSAYFIPCQGSV